MFKLSLTTLFTRFDFDSGLRSFF